MTWLIFAAGLTLGSASTFAATLVAQPRLRRLLLGIRRDVRRARLAGATASGLFVFGELASKNTGEQPVVAPEPEPEPERLYDWQQEEAIRL